MGSMIYSCFLFIVCLFMLGYRCSKTFDSDIKGMCFNCKFLHFECIKHFSNVYLSIRLLLTKIVVYYTFCYSIFICIVE